MGQEKLKICKKNYLRLVNNFLGILSKCLNLRKKALCYNKQDHTKLEKRKHELFDKAFSKAPIRYQPQQKI